MLAKSKIFMLKYPMTPLPKRKHSKARKGARILARKREHSLPDLVLCECGAKKLPHHICKSCNK